MTFHRLLTMVNAERSYHQHALAILEKLHAEMTLERQSKEFSSLPMKIHRNVYEWLGNQDNNSQESDDHQDNMFFIAKVIHQFDAKAEGELSLLVDDYVRNSAFAAKNQSWLMVDLKTRGIALPQSHLPRICLQPPFNQQWRTIAAYIFYTMRIISGFNSLATNSLALTTTVGVV
nr:SH3 domain-containing protein 1-like [Ziziphus jujuba var. spinosa]